MNKARRRYWSAAARGQLGGYGSYGPGTKAVLKVGLRAGLNYGGWKEGDKITPTSAETAIFGRRAAQVGGNEVGLTTIKAGGRYKGVREPSISVELVHTGAAGETRAKFFRNVKKLAQDVAGDLAQREVIVEWSAPGRRGRTDTATPTKAPSATNAPKFCEWVRQHSTQSRKNPRDACYPKKKRRRS